MTLPRVVVVATKAPWPPVDGGRRLLLATLEALAERGLEPTLLAPEDAAAPAAEEALRAICRPLLVPSPEPSTPRVLARALGGLPLSPARHRRPELGRRLAALLEEEDVDVVHVEQLQALPQVGPAFERAVPVVLRAQNIESDLTGVLVPPWARALAPLEAWRYRRWESFMLRRPRRVVALSGEDARRLAGLAGRGLRPVVVPAPQPVELPAGPPRRGTPAVAVLAGSGWAPTRQGAEWFAREVWPWVLKALPGAVLHLFGLDGRDSFGIEHHPAPEDSAAAFPEGGIAVVPTRDGSGVRMKILEAWARGVPVVATRAGAAGLEGRNDDELLLGDKPEELVRQIERLATLPSLAPRLVAGGRALLRDRHRPGLVADRLIQVYRSVAG